MADLLLDHNVSREIAALLSTSGHNAHTAIVLGLDRADDDQILLVGSDNGLTIVTHNRKDFRLLHNAWRRWSSAWESQAGHAGILILGEAPPADLAAAIRAILLEAPQLANQLYEWSRGNGWTLRSETL